MPRKAHEPGGPSKGFSASALVHPVYLDVPMLVSFVAAVEDGVSFGGEQTTRQTSSSANEADATARVGLPSLLSLVGFDLSGRLKQGGAEEASEEMKVVRRHTEASLFNRLRSRLHDEQAVIEVAGAEDIANLAPGDLVELSGEVVGNPLQQVLDLMARIAPYAGIDLKELEKPARRSGGGGKGSRGGSGQQLVPAAAQVDDSALRLMLTMQKDLDDSLVRDLVLRAEDDLRTVLTLSTEFLTQAVQDNMLGGRLRVLGKTTRVIEAGDTVNLMRRTALGTLTADMVRSMVADMAKNMEELDFDMADPVIEAPALQVLPLGVFV